MEHFISIQTHTNGLSDNFRLIKVESGRAVFQNSSKNKTTVSLPISLVAPSVLEGFNPEKP